MRRTYKILVGKTSWKVATWENVDDTGGSIEVVLREVGCEGGM
jgi:hypothetical protein